MDSLPKGYRAVVAGCTGGIGKAFVSLLTEDKNCSEVIGISRSTNPHIDFTDEELQELINIMDAGVKAQGLQAVQNAFVLLTKIQGAEVLPDEEMEPAKVKKSSK